MPRKFYPTPNFPQSDLGRRADSRWALPQISSLFIDYFTRCSVESHLRCSGIYTVFYKKDPFMFFPIIHSSDDQFAQNLY